MLPDPDEETRERPLDSGQESREVSSDRKEETREASSDPDEEKREAPSNPEKETREAPSDSEEETKDATGFTAGLAPLEGLVVPARRKPTISGNLAPNNFIGHVESMSARRRERSSAAKFFTNE